MKCTKNSKKETKKNNLFVTKYDNVMAYNKGDRVLIIDSIG